LDRYRCRSLVVALLIFILQNMRSVKTTFLTVIGTIPVRVAMHFAAIGGLLLAGLVASFRIWQLHYRIAKAGTGGLGPPPEPVQ
jgi:uncharacterized integral membrane protein